VIPRWLALWFVPALVVACAAELVIPNDDDDDDSGGELLDDDDNNDTSNPDPCSWAAAAFGGDLRVVVGHPAEGEAVWYCAAEVTREGCALTGSASCTGYLYIATWCGDLEDGNGAAAGELSGSWTEAGQVVLPWQGQVEPLEFTGTAEETTGDGGFYVAADWALAGAR